MSINIYIYIYIFLSHLRKINHVLMRWGKCLTNVSTASRESKDEQPDKRSTLGLQAGRISNAGMDALERSQNHLFPHPMRSTGKPRPCWCRYGYRPMLVKVIPATTLRLTHGCKCTHTM